MSVLLKMALAMTLTTTFATQTLGQSEAPVASKKPKVVNISFSPSQAVAKRTLTRSERLRAAATQRHERRLQAGYNQPIPF